MSGLFRFKSSVWVWIFLVFLLGMLQTGSAQDSPADSLWHVVTKDGNTYTGKLENLGADGVRITSTVGAFTIPLESIVNMRRVEGGQVVGGQYWMDNPHTTRHFWGPSGFGLRKGSGYYQNTWIVLNQVSYGLTDQFTIGVGIVPLFLFGVTQYLPTWITPKFNFDYANGKGALGVGTIFAGVLGTNGSGVGILYGVNTFGTRDRQFTLGLGYGYSTRDGFANLPTITASGLIRTGSRWALVTENYLISAGNSSLGFLSVGGRYIGSRLSIDIGGVIPVNLGIDVFIAIPWLSITVPIGRL